MKFTRLFFVIAMVFVFYSCGNDPNQLSVINSKSFHETQIQLQLQPVQPLFALDSLSADSILKTEQHFVTDQLDEMLSMTENIRKSGSDSIWISLVQKWNDFNTIIASQTNSPTHKMFPEAILKWVELNVALVKLSGEARFGDAIEKMMHGPDAVSVPEKLIKSVIYTHVDDKIFINIIGPSSMEYQHTTGGNVSLIQETDYPESDAMTLKSKCSDKRFMDVYIRIPSWAVNPTVRYGNVKYVARPGEYTQISRKWKDGDEISVDLKN